MTDRLLGALVTMAAGAGFITDFTTPVLGVGLPAVCGAALGALSGIGFDESDRPKGRKYMIAFSCAVGACFFVGVAPSWLGWEWYDAKMEGAMVGLTTVIAYLFFPDAISRIRSLIATVKWADVLPWMRKREQKP